ncbi:dipeptidyl peptidase [Metarhizium album ARSEF 1941]|uniref:Dipeptidyl-peptidase V n=1 Tax=Metarhizium album (strain ARSEF 1941) TaxID=1081103 RepID=A0A0B2WQS3_METAS|nr:dipeptidyl peptidase [Metarhizium album ARSEF 1941]KHN95315.1 dipeptidyl peptidase [Metarhizium album ARSEF 1941]
MTVHAARLTPEVLLSAPRRSTGVPNSTGELVLYTVSAYSFETHSKSSQLRVLNIKEGTSHLVSEDPGVSDPVWIGETEVMYLKGGDNGCTMIMTQRVLDNSEPQMAHYLAGNVSSPKTKVLSNDKVAICFVGLTTPKGDLYWPPVDHKAYDSARIYTSLYVRHWDTWNTPNENSLWYGQLAKIDGKWALDSPGLTNLLAGTDLKSPVPPFGAAGDFDISAHGICFVARDPELNPARYTKTDLYYVPIKSFVEKPHAPEIVKTGKLVGYSIAPTFNKDGSKIAFARMKDIQYEADKTRLMLVPDVNDVGNVEEFYETSNGEGGWDLRPDWIIWSHDEKNLYVGAEKHGQVLLWMLPSSPGDANELPTPFRQDGSVSDAKLLGDGPCLFISSKSRIESSLYSVLDPVSKSATEISSSSKNGKCFGLNKSMRADFWYRGSLGYDVHALVTRPSDFDPSKKYPLAFLIHGGPQGAWLDEWSTRWNPAIFAEQCYVVVSPNVTGSTGYGQKHIDAITCNWGGNPYEDLVLCFEHLEKNVNYIDTSRSVALGASYGGYMINWIQGQPLGRKFKALVCHDGVFCTQNQWSSEELFFPEHDFGSTLWENRETYVKWDPSLYCQNWETPMLVLHNELDYRLPISEGLAMFNVLQARKVPSKLVVFPDENHVSDYCKDFTKNASYQTG